MRLRVIAAAALLALSACTEQNEPAAALGETAVESICHDLQTGLADELGLFPSGTADLLAKAKPPGEGFVESHACEPWLTIADKPRIPALELDLVFDVFDAANVPADLPGETVTAAWCESDGGHVEERASVPVCRYADEPGDSGTTAKAVVITRSTAVTLTVYAVAAQSERLTPLTDKALDLLVPLLTTAS